MVLQLKTLRRAAGYRNRDLFAREMGVTARTLKAWECEEVNMPLAMACRAADILGCSLDKLAGRSRDEDGYFAVDERLVEIRKNFETLDETGRDLAAGAVRGIAGATARGRTQDEHNEDATA